jgi:aspartate/methionine/tyrosine aminotransferase
MLAYVNPGDEVIYPSPGFPVYESWVTFVGAKPVPMRLRESAGFAMTADDLAELITDKTKVIILNSPANPTGGLIEADALAEMAAVIRDKAPADVRVYSYEIYENILFDGRSHSSIASQPGMEPHTIIASGHSKSFAMTGWRLGYVVLPTVEEAEVFKNFNINIISCTPPFIQEAGRVALESPESAVAIGKMVEAFDARRKVVVETLNNIPGITCVMPKGAFYVFPNVAGACESLGAVEAFEKLPAAQQAKSSPSTLLQMFVLYRYGVATMDRPSFCRIGSDCEHYLRLSTATNLEQLREGLSRLETAVSDADGFADFVAQGVPA